MAMKSPEKLKHLTQPSNDPEQVTAASLDEPLYWPRFLKNTYFQRRVSKIGNWVNPVILLVIDYLVILGASLTSYYILNLIVPYLFPSWHLIVVDFDYPNFIIPLIYISLIGYERLYTKRLAFWQNAAKLFKISTYATAITIGIMYFTGAPRQIPRKFLVLTWLISFVYLLTARYLAKKLMVVCGLWQKPVVVVGTGKSIRLLDKAFKEEPNKGYKIAGVIDDNFQLSLLDKFPVIGKYANAEQVITASGVQNVIIAAPGIEQNQLLDLVNRIQPMVKELTIMPNLIGIPLCEMEVEPLFNQKIMLLRTRNNLLAFWNRFYKQIFDFVVGSLIFILIIPVLLILLILIKLDSPGPVLYIGKRLGKKGREFNCYKFRTMYINEAEILQQHLENNKEAKEEWNRFAKLKSYDPRLTKIGKWLRKLSMDELPQIINVLKGEMSLVGPRPYMLRESKRMGNFADCILETEPGITGLWQVSGRNEIDFEGRLYLDSWYVRNWSFWLDLEIVLKTIKVIFERKGAY